tara:strand:+ start:1467 stop:2015 length:549 start_codon:yes stop_codon:yes gene_type:complete
MAVNNKTYNNVVNFLARLGQYHEQISTVSVGDIYDVAIDKNLKMPLLHINPINVTTGDSELVYNFQIFIMDLVSNDMALQTREQYDLSKLINNNNNQQEVWNQTLDIATDFIGMLRHSSRQSLEGVNDINFPLYFTQDQFTLDPFQERFDDLASGWVFQIGVKVMNDFDTCNIPVTNQGAGY